MKNFALLLLFLVAGAVTFAQAPQAFRYQAVARDGSGNVLANKAVCFRISILSGSTSGTVVCSETHNGKTTNAFGLIDLETGNGSPVSGKFKTIPWHSESYYLKVELDPAGGGDDRGTQTAVTDASLSGNGLVSSPLRIAPSGVTTDKIAEAPGTSGKLASEAVTTYENGKLYHGTNGAARLIIAADGNVGIGTTVPGKKPDVNGAVNIRPSSGYALYCNDDEAIWYNGTCYGWGYGGTYNYFADHVTIGTSAVPGYNLVVNGTTAKTGGGSRSTLSDARLKNIPGNYEKGLDEIIALKPIRFTCKEGLAR